MTLVQAIITTHRYCVRLLLVLISSLGSPTPTIYPQLSSYSEGLYKSDHVTSLLRIL